MTRIAHRIVASLLVVSLVLTVFAPMAEARFCRRLFGRRAPCAEHCCPPVVSVPAKVPFYVVFRCQAGAIYFHSQFESQADAQKLVARLRTGGDCVYVEQFFR